jgi:hypothetical protein
MKRSRGVRPTSADRAATYQRFRGAKNPAGKGYIPAILVDDLRYL